MSRTFVISVIAGVAILVPAGSALAAKSQTTAGNVRGVTHDQNFEDWANLRTHRGRVVVGEDGNGALALR